MKKPVARNKRMTNGRTTGMAITKIGAVLLAVLFMTLVSFHSFCLVPSVNATETLTLTPIACASISNMGDTRSEMLVLFEHGVKYVSYFVFNTSGIPVGTSIESAIFEVKTQVVATPSWVSVHCLPVAWTKFSWEDRVIGKRIDAKWIAVMEEWYSFKFPIEMVEASIKTKGLTISLESSLFGIDQVAVIIFHDNARLVINYTPDTVAPSLSNIRSQPGRPTPDDEATVSVTATDDKSGVKEAYLYYSTDGGANWVKVLMSPVADSNYKAKIPQQSEDTTVQYYIEAFDNALNKVKSETSSYTVKSPPETLDVLIRAFVVFGIPIIIGILIFRFIRKKRRGRGSVAK